jgi:hypothetical protein
MSSRIIKLPSSVKRGAHSRKQRRSKNGLAQERALKAGPASRTRHRIQEDIKAHVAARAAYGNAVAWEAAAESENLPAQRIEEAQKRTADAFEEMQLRGRNLVIVMPTDRRALVDLLLYLQNNFSVLPQEIVGRSLALKLLQTMRLSLRKLKDTGRRAHEAQATSATGSDSRVIALDRRRGLLRATCSFHWTEAMP